MKPNCLRVVSLLALASVALTAQVARQETVVPLKNWVTPLYWQPSQTERQDSGGPQPQLQFSASQVSSNALTFIAITPCRLVDTRGGTFNGIPPFSGPSIGAMTTATFPVQSATEASTNTAPAPCGTIPSIAQAYSLNLTVVPVAGGAVDYISMWPSGYAQPFVATLNDPQGAIVANAAIVPAGTVSGGISVYNQGPATANVIVDMNGFFAAPSDLNDNTAIGAGALASNTTGEANTAVGSNALALNTTGFSNTASGFQALAFNSTGSGDTATGTSALALNTTGNNNTASGAGALQDNTTGNGNTATGFNALLSNTTGSNNTANGSSALHNNTTGEGNIAVGASALQNNITGNSNVAIGGLPGNTTGSGNTALGGATMGFNTSGSFNTAAGDGALGFNSTASGNSAFGAQALQSNLTASGNAAFGYQALTLNSGANNTAFGYQALGSNSTGTNNIAIGQGAAYNVLGPESNNIHIGNGGFFGDSGVIKIGAQGTQTSTYIAGIYNGTPGTPNLLVCVDADGTLGTTGCTNTPSSRRFKEQITDMGDTSSKLFQLRPITFLYKPEYDDGSHSLQYGLIAEEVAKIYPDMVGYDKEGQPSSVKYQALAPMLLNEVQKQAEQSRQQTEEIWRQAEVNQFQQEENQKLEDQNRNLADRLAALEALLSGQTTTATRPAGSQ